MDAVTVFLLQCKDECKTFIRFVYAPLAQLEEQLTLNQWVLGSSPRWRTIWPVGQAVKTPASHAGNASSILARVTICFWLPWAFSSVG